MIRSPRPRALRRSVPLVALLLALGGCDRSAAPLDADDPAVGRNTYLTHCSACHQREGEGLRGAFPPLAGADWLAEQPTEAAIAVVLNGISGPLTVNGETYNGMMPPAAHLSDAQIAAILGHVYRSWGNDGRAVSAEQVAAVRAGGPPQAAPASPPPGG
jgi:nitrite reductase (NO-forming) / hydroxylamine reductase